METSPRLSRTAVFVGLVAAGCCLCVAAPVVRPAVWPDRVEEMPSLIAWWVGAVLLIWLSLSLAMWSVALGRPTLETSRLLRALSVPGSRRLAEGLLTAGVLASCASPSQLTAPQIEVLGPAESVASIRPEPASAVPSVTVHTADLPPVSSALASGGSLSDARDLVRPVEVDPAGPGGTSLGPVIIPEAAPSDLRPEAGPAEVTPDAPTTHVVISGDSMWTIAGSHLSARLGRPATDSEIGPYWIAVIRTNAGSITSGDPNLIFPGEVIALPPVA